MDFINSQYKTVELIKEDKYGSEYLVQDVFKDNMLKRMRVVDYSHETKNFIEYMKVNYYDYLNLIHPNIAEFYYFNKIRIINAKPVVSNKFYYTYEYYKGENVFTFSKDKDFDRLLDIAAQLCSAFKFIHLKNMLFCSISSDQINIIDNNQLKIAALCYKNPMHESFIIDGKDVYFKAPEVIQYSRYTKQSDIYMLGVILFHVFTGIPMEGSSFKERIEDIECNDTELGKIIDIVRKCTSADISSRYESIDEVIYDINRNFDKSFIIIEKKYIETFPLYPTSLVARETYIKYITDSIHKYFYEYSELKAAIITGRPGTGKGAFLYALQSRMHQEGEDVVYLNLKQNGYQKYYAITELIKNVAKYAPKEFIDKYSESLCYIIPEFISSCAVVPFYAKDEETEKYKLTYRLGNFILETSIKQPLIFMLKGFEYIDEASRDIIYYIMRNQSRGRIFYVISFEDETIQDRVRDHIIQLMGEEAVGGIQLSGLNINETSEMIKLLLGIEEVPSNFVSLIYKETGGNPYTIHEVIYALYMDKHIWVNDKGKWVFDDVDLSRLNLDVSPDEMLQNKINRLKPNKRELLDVISIFSSPVSLDLLENMMEMPAEEIMPLLDSMTTTNILLRRIDDWGISVDFISTALKRNIYAQLDDFTKYRYHEKASQVLEYRLLAENKENRDELIFQLTKSGKCDKAVDYLAASSDEIIKKGLIKQAIQFLEQAYGYFPEHNICCKKTEICVKLGNLYYKAAEFDKALEYYNIAQQNAEKNGGRELLADTHIKLVKLFYRLNDVKQCIKHSVSAKKLIEAIGYKKGMYELILALSELLIYRRKYNSYMRIIKKAMNSMDDDDKYYEAMFKGVYGRILAKINHYDRALKYLEESVEVLEALEEYEGLIPTLNTIGTVYSDYYYDIEKATEYFERNLNICRMTNNLPFMGHSYNNLAEMYREKDKYKESLEYYDKALEIMDKTNNRYLEIMIYMNQALANMELEDYRKCAKHLEKAETIISSFKDIGEAIQYFNIYQSLFLYNMGYFKEAMDHAQKAVDMCISWGMEADAEALYIINLCMAKLYCDLDFEKLIDFSKDLFKSRKYKLGRKACHNFAELFIEQQKLDEAKAFLGLSDEHSGDISTKHLENEYEYLSAMVCSGNERKEKLRILLASDKTIESNEIKWKVYKSLGLELYEAGEYREALKCLVTSLNSLRILVETVPQEKKIKFLLSHDRCIVREKLACIAQEVFGKDGLFGNVVLNESIKDVNKRIDEYFDYRQFKNIILKENMANIKSHIGLDRNLIGRFFVDLLDKISSLGQNTEDNINTMMEFLMDLIQAKNGFLAVTDEDNDIRMLAPMINSDNIAFYKYIMDQVRQKNESIMITDVFEYKKKTKDSIIPKDICSVFCMPITYSRRSEDYTIDRRKNKEANQISGYIYMDTDTIINNFTQETCRLCEEMSRLVYLLIENYNLKMISGIDKVTKLYTRKYFEMVLQNEIYLNSTSGGEFSLIMLDIDKFKQVNDRFGHQRGDEVLQKIAAIVLDNVRKSDICGRYGGEEFLILLPRTGAEGAYKLAEKIRSKVERANLLGYHNIITISLGIATYPIHSSGVKDLIDKADQALYQSKENGRNRATIFDINMTATSKRVDKLAGIISGNMMEDQRNVETMIEVLELQRNFKLSIDERLHDFLGKAVEISEADIGYIFILDERKNILKEIARKNINKKNVDNIPYNRNAVLNAIGSMSGEYFIDWAANTSIDPVTGMPNWQSKMIIPIVYANNIYGVLCLSVALRNKEFDANMYNYITRLCEIISPIFCLEKI